jgi:hypothetical protein
MPVLVAVVAVVSVLCVLNTVLCFAVIRRLREQTGLIEAVYEFNGAASGNGSSPAIGDTVKPFQATTTDGAPVGRDDLTESTVVAFMAVNCNACHEHLPEVLAWSRDHDRRRILAIVDGNGGDPADLVAQLSPVAQVIVADGETLVVDAFGVRSYPTFCVMGPGATIAAVAARVHHLPATLPA